jgi:hypothetical protein
MNLLKIVETCVNGSGDQYLWAIGSADVESRTIMMSHRVEQSSAQAPWNNDSLGDWEQKVHPERYIEPDLNEPEPDYDGEWGQE